MKNVTAALSFLNSVLTAYDPTAFQSSVYDVLPVSWMQGDTALLANVKEAYRSFVAHFIAEKAKFDALVSTAATSVPGQESQSQQLVKELLAELPCLRELCWTSSILVRQDPRAVHCCRAYSRVANWPSFLAGRG